MNWDVFSEHQSLEQAWERGGKGRLHMLEHTANQPEGLKSETFGMRRLDSFRLR